MSFMKCVYMADGFQMSSHWPVLPSSAPGDTAQYYDLYRVTCCMPHLLLHASLSPELFWSMNSAEKTLESAMNLPAHGPPLPHGMWVRLLSLCLISLALGPSAPRMELLSCLAAALLCPPVQHLPSHSV